MLNGCECAMVLGVVLVDDAAVVLVRRSGKSLGGIDSLFSDVSCKWPTANLNWGGGKWLLGELCLGAVGITDERGGSEDSREKAEAAVGSSSEPGMGEEKGEWHEGGGGE